MRPLVLRPLAALVGALVTGCATPPAPTVENPAARFGRVAPQDDAQAALLTRLDHAPASKPVQVAGRTYVVGPIYDAASSQRCRQIHAVGDRTPSLLACRARGPQAWHFVPHVVSRPTARTDSTAREASPTRAAAAVAHGGRP